MLCIIRKFVGLSRDWILKRMHDSETELLLEMKGKPCSQLCHHDWMWSYEFCTDIILHVNELNLKLQGLNHLIGKNIRPNKSVP